MKMEPQAVGTNSNSVLVAIGIVESYKPSV